MPRVSIVGQRGPGPYTDTAQVLTMTAADAVNDHQASFEEGMMILAQNTGVGARTVMVSSAPLFGRTNDLGPVSLAAGAIALFGPFKRAGWKQDDGYLYFEGEHAEVKFAVILPTRT